MTSSTDTTAPKRPPVPVSTTLPLPDPARYRHAKIRKFTIDGDMAYSLMNKSVGTTNIIWGGILAIVGFAVWARAEAGGYGHEAWLPITFMIVSVPFILYAIWSWLTGDVFHFILNRAGCEPGTAIATLMRRKEVVYHELIRWQDIKLADTTVPERSSYSRQYWILLSRAYDWPPSIRRGVKYTPAHSTGVVLRGAGEAGFAFCDLDDFQVAAGRPDGLTAREAFFPAVDDVNSWYMRLLFQGENEHEADWVLTRAGAREKSQNIWLSD